MDGLTAANFAQDLTKPWQPALRALVEHQDRTQTMPLRSVITPAPKYDWRAPTRNSGVNGSDPPESSPDLATQQDEPARTASSPMVTIVRDAAHALPPTSGVGATTALTDAAVLGAALAAHGVSQRALEVYEADVRGYATQAIEKSLQGGKMFANMRSLHEMKPIA